MKLPILLALTLTAPAFAASPIYYQAPPKTFCQSGKSLGVEDCNGNAAFYEAAKACWDKLESTHKRVKSELDARIKVGALAGQKGSYNTSQYTYEEGNKAQEYMAAIAKTALAEIDDYFDYIVYPEHAETDDEVMAEACYSEVVKPLDQLADKFENKLIDIVSSIEAADEMNKGLVGKDEKIDSSPANTQLQGAKGAAPQAAPKPGPNWRPSDISGTKEKQKK